MTVHVADTHVQRLVSVVKMATVLEECNTEEQRFLCGFCGQRDSMQRICIKKCFLFTMRSDCRVKRFAAGSEISLKDVQKSQMTPDQVRKWLRQQSKINYVAGFDALVKRWDKLVEDMSRDKCFSQVRISYVLRFYIHLWPIYWLSLVLYERISLKFSGISIFALGPP
jgi:hypothetical protein